MNLLFFLTPKQDVLFIYEDFTLRQTLEKWSNQRFATIPVLKRNGEYLGTMTEGDILWGIKSIHGLDIDASEDIPIASFPRRRDYKAVPVTTDMHALLNAAVDQNFVPVVDDRNVFIGIVRRTAILQQVAKDVQESAKIDGAGPIKTLWFVTIPMMGPILKIILMLAITSAFNDITNVMVLTEGGPNNATIVMSLYAYQ